MTKEKKLKIIKIFAIVVWVLLMMFPTIYTETNQVTLVQKDIRYIVENDSYEFTLTCDRDIVSGEVTFGFYDSDLEALSTYTTEFKQDANENVVIVIASNDIPDEVAEYKVEEMYVKSSTASVIGLILYPTSCVYAVLLVALLRVSILSYDYKGKKVEVFAGLRNHRLSVDGEIVAEQKKMFFLNPLTLEASMDDGSKIYAQIFANHKISLFTKNEEVKEKKENATTEQTTDAPTITEEKIESQAQVEETDKVEELEVNETNEGKDE